MFSKKPVNRKRHRNRKRPTASRQPRKRPGPETLESLRDREHQLNAQIGELEEVLARHQQAEDRQKNMRQANVLPPPDYSSLHHQKDRDSLTYSEKRRQNRERNASGFYFLILLMIAAGLAFWLFYTGG